ncbi:hypothetical protein ILUMI_07397, partial [Ignelater luminosus]
AEQGEGKGKAINCTFIINEHQKSIHHLQSENEEIKKTVENLIKENSRLKLQITSSEERQRHKSSFSELKETCRRVDHDTDYKALKSKLQELESDNNLKYIKIIDLMEEKESLENQLKKVNNDDKEELVKLQKKFSDLQHQRKELLEALEKVKWEKENADAITKHLQSVKHECEILQNQLQHFRKVGEELSVEFEKISNENIGLKTNINNLVGTISELNSEKTDLLCTIQRLQSDIQENEEKEMGKTAFENKYKEAEESLLIQTEEIKTFKDSLSQQQKVIEALNQKITELTITNSKVSENLNEKECQTNILKQIINHQNENLKSLENEKESIISKLHEQSGSEKLLNENKELREKLKCAMSKLSIEQESKVNIVDSNIELTEKLEFTTSELYREKCKNQKITDNNTKIIGEFQNTIKELQRQNNELREKLNAIKRNQGQSGDEKGIKDNKELEKKLECLVTQLNKQQNDNKELIRKLQCAATELGEYQSQNEKLVTANKELIEKLESKGKEIQNLVFKLKILEESNKNVKAEFDTVSYDYKNVKNINNNIMKENELLSYQKNILVNKLEQLGKFNY